jgi:hypothetical protein
MKARDAARIRYAILSAREEYEPLRMMPWQEDFCWVYGEPKSWLLDGRIENAAYEQEARKAFMRIASTERKAWYGQ